VPQAESASPQVRSRETQSERVSPQVPQSQEPLCWQEEAQPQVPPGAKQPAQPISLPRALPFQLQPPAPQASVAQPQAL
jgi:hypothetical protein